jgi:GT2 family glycosyltransferase
MLCGMLAYTTVIPTMNRPERARAVVEAMLKQTLLPQGIVVVDASTPPLALPEEVAQRVRSARVQLTLVHVPPSTAGQRNRGVEHAETPLVLFLDDDVELEPRYAEELVARWEHAGLEAIGGMVGSPEFVPPQGTARRIARRAGMLHYHANGGLSTTFRRSRKLRFVARPHRDVEIPAVGAGGAMFRTDLLRRHPFDERFPGYALGEDLDMSYRLSRDAPIIQTPAVRFLHEWDPGERESSRRWHYRGRRETYFRLRHLGTSPIDRAAFAVSIAAETLAAAIDSLAERDTSHVRAVVGGVSESLREERERRQH